jgi:hypothetical protein
MLDGQPKDSSTVTAALSGMDGMLEKIAREQYRVGSMLLGEGEETIRVIERVVGKIDLPGCCDQADARHRGRVALASEAIELLSRRDPLSLAAPAPDSVSPASCIEDDDLSAAGVTPSEFERMLTGPDSSKLRTWLESLSVGLRTIFVLRAVASLPPAEVAALLTQNGGPVAQGWTPDAVRSGFRQALCSLASHLILLKGAVFANSASYRPLWDDWLFFCI